MQYLNNDIEKLLRKAANEAPVKPKGADWDKIAGQLQQRETPNNPQPKRDFKKFLLVVPLLLAGFVCDRFFWAGFKYGQQQSAMISETAQKGFENVAPINNKLNDEGRATKRQNKIINTPLIDKIVFVFTQVNNDNKITGENTLVTADEKNTAVEKEISADAKMDGVVDSTAVLEEKITTDTIKVNEQVQGKKKMKGRFYLSALVAPDVSTIKFQKVDALGYGGGLKLGYNINEKWSVETGVLWQHKEYYTDAEHFKTDKIYIPQNVKMINASGYCEMLEIPLDVRYDYKKSSRNNWYALAGLSTYLMMKEDYDYLMERNGQQYNYAKYYNKPSQYIFSIVNLGAGLEHKVGRAGSIRLEPYVKLPLKGMGVGSLPFTSSGVNIGFTHPF